MIDLLDGLVQYCNESIEPSVNSLRLYTEVNTRIIDMSLPIYVEKANKTYSHSPYINLTDAVPFDDTTGFLWEVWKLVGLKM